MRYRFFSYSSKTLPTLLFNCVILQLIWILWRSYRLLHMVFLADSVKTFWAKEQRSQNHCLIWNTWLDTTNLRAPTWMFLRLLLPHVECALLICDRFVYCLHVCITLIVWILATLHAYPCHWRQFVDYGLYRKTQLWTCSKTQRGLLPQRFCVVLIGCF